MSRKISMAVVMLIVWGMLLVGCSTLQKRSHDPSCKALYEKIQHGWFRDAQGLHRLTAEGRAEDRYGSFHDDACLLGLAPKDVERLFGKPDTVVGGTMLYYRSAPCLGKGGVNCNNCSYMSIKFDGDAGLKSILFGSTQVDHGGSGGR